jgi:hypothetical protein
MYGIYVCGVMSKNWLRNSYFLCMIEGLLEFLCEEEDWLLFLADELNKSIINISTSLLYIYLKYLNSHI